MEINVNVKIEGMNEFLEKLNVLFSNKGVIAIEEEKPATLKADIPTAKIVQVVPDKQNKSSESVSTSADSAVANSVSFGDIKKLAITISENKGSLKMKELLREFGTDKLSGLKESDYPAFYRNLKKEFGDLMPSNLD